MSEQSKYQEGIIILSNGAQVPFLCRPLTFYADEEDLEEITVKDIKFVPPVDRAEELKDKILKDKIGELPEEEVNDAPPQEGQGLDDDIGWGEGY